MWAQTEVAKLRQRVIQLEAEVSRLNDDALIHSHRHQEEVPRHSLEYTCRYLHSQQLAAVSLLVVGSAERCSGESSIGLGDDGQVRLNFVFPF